MFLGRRHSMHACMHAHVWAREREVRYEKDKSGQVRPKRNLSSSFFLLLVARHGTNWVRSSALRVPAVCCLLSRSSLDEVDCHLEHDSLCPRGGGLSGRRKRQSMYVLLPTKIDINIIYLKLWMDDAQSISNIRPNRWLDFIPPIRESFLVDKCCWKCL